MDQQTSERIQYPPVGVKDVAAAFWSQIQPLKLYIVVIVLCVVCASSADVVAPIFYKQFFDTLPTAGANEYSTLLAILVQVALIHGVGWLAWRIMTFTSNHFQATIIANLKRDAYDHLMHHSYSFFSNSFTGSLVQRVNRYARAFERIADRISYNVLPLSVRIAGTVTVLFFIKPVLVWVVLAYLAAFMGFNYFFARWKLKYDIASAAADSRTTAVLADTITNHNNIQLFARHRKEYMNYHEVTETQRRLLRFNWNLTVTAEAVQAFLIIIIEFIFLYVLLRSWRTGVVPVGTFVLVQTYILSLSHSLWDFSRIIRDTFEGFADAKEMVQIIKLPREIKDAPGAVPLTVTKGEIVYKDVSFSFSSTREVIKRLSLTIAAGEKVALVGPSGAGKTTLVRLLLRLYDPTSGALFIDGQPIVHVTLDSLMHSISLVPQDPILFHRTLLENIRYGRLEASDEEVTEAGRLAHCDEFVKELPQGYETFVGERGIKLSGGERQRVAIARAILKNAPILILDEATSSLDSYSESLIQDALETLMKGKTTIVIAHRLSTIRKMDRVVVIDGGTITEEGPHDALIQKKGSLYAKLWALQAGGFLSSFSETRGIAAGDS